MCLNVRCYSDRFDIEEHNYDTIAQVNNILQSQDRAEYELIAIDNWRSINNVPCETVNVLFGVVGAASSFA